MLRCSGAWRIWPVLSPTHMFTLQLSICETFRVIGESQLYSKNSMANSTVLVPGYRAVQTIFTARLCMLGHSNMALRLSDDREEQVITGTPVHVRFVNATPGSRALILRFPLPRCSCSIDGSLARGSTLDKILLKLFCFIGVVFVHPSPYP